MKPDRTYIIWVPQDGLGKTRKFLIGPSFIRILLLMIIICVCAVPFLETGMLTLYRKVTDLEETRDELLTEIESLKYLERELALIEEKDRAFREYFGMEKYQSLDQIIGKGGIPDAGNSREDLYHFALIDKPEPQHVTSGRDLPRRFRILNSNRKILIQLLKEKDKALEYTPSIIPVEMDEPRISSGFGWRRNPFTDRREFHVGIDIIGPEGTGIIAPAAGVVIKKGYDQWLGNFLVLQHGEEIKTIYGHLKDIVVKEGVRVKRGDMIGTMGNSGLSTSNHLHYAVIKNDRAVNPMVYILDVRGG